MDKSPRYILVADNDPDYLNAVVMRLEIEGYTVYSADSLSAVQQHLNDHYLDLIIIDNRLDNNDNPFDHTGAEFVNNADPSQAIILMSYYFESGLQLAHVTHHVRTFSKRRAGKELLELVKGVLRTVTPYNETLKIQWAGDTSAEEVAAGLATESDANVSQMRLVKECDQILRKLFRIESNIIVHAIEEGRGGAATLKVYSTISQAVQRPPIIVKFGRRENIQNELDNYRLYVQPYFYMRTTQMVGQPAYTHHLAGFKQMFIGYEQYWRPHLNGHRASDLISFATAFRKFSSSELHYTLKALFLETYSVWFAGRESLRRTENHSLKKFKSTIQTYEQSLKLGERAKRERIGDKISALHNTSIDGVQIIVEEKFVTFKHGRRVEKLPHPVYFWQNFQHCIPDTAMVSLTHGDLNPNNIFVNRTLDSWLIDFQRAGWGPMLRDSAELESSIKFSLLQTQKLSKLLKFENAILQMPNLGSWSVISGHKTVELEKAEFCIRAIREEMAKLHEQSSSMEYYAGLFFYALKMLSFDANNRSLLVEKSPDRLPICHAHILYSAAKIADILLKQGEQTDV